MYVSAKLVQEEEGYTHKKKWMKRRKSNVQYNGLEILVRRQCNAAYRPTGRRLKMTSVSGCTEHVFENNIPV